MKKMDIRTRFTKQALKDSLLELMKTTPIRDIPIKAIWGGAGVSRSTFYAYYDNQFDLLEEIQNEFIKIDDNTSTHTHKGENLTKNTVDCETGLRYIAENHNSIRVLFSENGDINFQRKLIEQHITEMAKTIKRNSETLADEKIERYYSVFFMNSCLAMMQEWLKNDIDIPVPQMAKLFSKLMHKFLR